MATSTTVVRDQAPGTARPAPRWVFTLTVLFGSFLLFQVQPMVARLALPDLGGAPSVWNSAMLVYQALLLAGYGWAHWLHRFPVRRQVLLHVGLLVLACAWLPVGLVSMEPPTGNSVVVFVPLLLLVSVGPVILAVSAQAPMMQGWFAAGGAGRNPYPLYAASNLGSFAGLLAYPLLVEPTLRLGTQRWGWTVLYGVLVVLVVTCGTVAARSVRGGAGAPVEAPVARSPKVDRSRVVLWLALSAVPSGLMLSTTTHLSTDIMAMPLLWAIPLGLYLLSFTVAFADRRGPARVVNRAAPVLLLGCGAMALLSGGTSGYPVAALSVLTLFAVAVALHSRLYDARPPADQLTHFYLTTSVGGALGGVFCGLLAPVVFDWVYEHPVLVVAAAALIPLQAVVRRYDPAAVLPADQQLRARIVLVVVLVAASAALFVAHGPSARLLLVAGIGAVGVICCSWRSVYLAALVGLMVGLGAPGTVLASLDGSRSRSYFGVYTVLADDTRRVLVHGQTIHGVELLGPDVADVPTTYYGPRAGVGIVLSRARELFGPAASVGVVGLGTGTLACYAEPGQTWRFFEIDPAMVRIAQDPSRFRFLSDCAPDAEVTVGDARLELAKVAGDSYDVLVVDAFSSDAIPMHLMTEEAFALYDRVVRERGLVLVHVTNRFVDLEPVLSALVEDAGWSAAVRDDEPSDDVAEQFARAHSVWVALSRDAGVLDDRLAAADPDAWRPLHGGDRSRLWTDDYASVLPLLK